MAKVKGFRTMYNDQGYKDLAYKFTDVSMTDETYRALSSIYYLLNQVKATPRTPVYGEQDQQTYEDWSNQVAHVKRKFFQLTTEEQRKYGDVQTFLQYCSDPNNFTHLWEKDPEPEPAPEPVPAPAPTE